MYAHTLDNTHYYATVTLSQINANWQTFELDCGWLWWPFAGQSLPNSTDRSRYDSENEDNEQDNRDRNIGDPCRVIFIYVKQRLTPVLRRPMCCRGGRTWNVEGRLKYRKLPSKTDIKLTHTQSDWPVFINTQLLASFAGGLCELQFQAARLAAQAFANKHVRLYLDGNLKCSTRALASAFLRIHFFHWQSYQLISTFYKINSNLPQHVFNET